MHYIRMPPNESFSVRGWSGLEEKNSVNYAATGHLLPVGGSLNESRVRWVGKVVEDPVPCFER